MIKTNKGLVEYVKKAYSEKWGYCLGCYGQILTEKVLNAKMKQGYGVGAYNTRHKNYLYRYMGQRVSDCYGLVKGYIWTSNDRLQYDSKTDRNQEMAYRDAKEKGSISTMPEIPGLILWIKGHAGVYIGGGEFIEIVGAPTGMRKGKIQSGRITYGTKFTHWFKDTYIDYNYQPTNPRPTRRVGTITPKGGAVLRQGPGTNYKRITLIPFGTKIIVIGEKGSWYEVEYLTSKGYTHKDLIEINKVGNTKLVVDGRLGPKTISELQRQLGTPVDGEIWEVSAVVKELQRRLNNKDLIK